MSLFKSPLGAVFFTLNDAPLQKQTLTSLTLYSDHMTNLSLFLFLFYFFSHLFFDAVVNKNLHTFQSGIPTFEPTRDGVIYFIIFINFLSYLTPIILRHVLKTIQHPYFFLHFCNNI